MLLLLVKSACSLCYIFFFFKQKTAYEMRISDWSSDVCSSDLHVAVEVRRQRQPDIISAFGCSNPCFGQVARHRSYDGVPALAIGRLHGFDMGGEGRRTGKFIDDPLNQWRRSAFGFQRSEEHTSELQSLMRTSYADFCLKKKKHKN